MYMSDYNKSSTNMMIVLGIVMLIVGFTIGRLTIGTSTVSPEEDHDAISIGNQQIYTDETVSTDYFWLTGIHLSEIGNPHDTLCMKTFDIGSLEVNQFTYVLRCSDDTSEIYIVELTPEADESFQIMEYYNETSGDISGSFELSSLHSIGVYIFYTGVQVVSIEGIFDYV